MNSKQHAQVMEQLPPGTKITKVYNAFENGELRIVTKEPDEQFEKRYVVSFEGDNTTITHKP